MFTVRVFYHVRWLALLAVGSGILGPRVEAQSFGLLVTASPPTVAVSNSLSYAITVTNRTGLTRTVIVTNRLPGSVLLQSASPSPSATNGTTFTFVFLLVPNNGIRQVTLTVLPTTGGDVTNRVAVVDSNNQFLTSTNVVTPVTSTLAQADLAVATAAPTPLVFTNDWTVYDVTVTNLGPADAPDVILTNALPPGVGFKRVSPSFPRSGGGGSNVIFNLGKLASGAFTNLKLTVQPTNAGALTLVSSIGSSGVNDPNPTNNSARSTITVIGYYGGQVLAFTNSGQLYNSQNGLVEQGITVANTGTNAVAAVRVLVEGLTNRLFNAVGTNDGNPFVVYNRALDPNRSVNLRLQYSASAYFPFADSQLHAYAVFLPDLTPPAATGKNASFNISRIARRPDGSFLVEWPSKTNRTYTVVYSDNAGFSNALIAPPAVVAPANRTQWIDYGPPTTLSHPTNAPIRFYRVILNP
jgi:uncharacterized repeat protein (TIGR01451 family)